MVERPASPTLGELAENLQKALDLHRSTYDSPASHSLSLVAETEPANFTSRIFGEPIACVAISPDSPEYMLIGTYALLKKDEVGESRNQVRTGSVSVLPLADIFKPAYPGNVAPLLDSKCLNAAVLDIKFHPVYTSLFGVATSNAKMTFFRLYKHADVLARRVEMRLVYLGSIKISQPNQHGEIPLVTAFAWLPRTTKFKRQGVYGYQSITFAATVSDGSVKLIRAIIPALDDFPVPGYNEADMEAYMVRCVDLEKHTEEAWIAAAADISKSNCSLGEVHKLLILSGGDDSALIGTIATISPVSDTEQGEVGSILDTPPKDKTRDNNNAVLPSDTGGVDNDNNDNNDIDDDDNDNYEDTDSISISPSDVPLPLERGSPLLMAPAMHQFTDRRTHSAGVVAILPLMSQALPFTTQKILPILTGSYDDHIRLFAINPINPATKRTLLLEEKLGAGVWRLKLMNETTIPVPTTTTSPNRQSSYSALVLASNMLAGAKVLRVSYSPQPSIEPEANAREWKIQVVQRFTKGHESMVYGTDFRKDKDEAGNFTGEYTIVSTSFYDMKICVWKFVDEEA